VYRKAVKPLFDLVGAAVLLIITAPLMAITAMALFIGNRGKVWFVQERPGKQGTPFMLIKFRTMNDAMDERGALLPDALRLTIAGKWVRKLSLDELPQLINILKGEMSFVGPRPWLMEYLPLYNEFQFRRHEVKPGITGWAQVNGRNTLDWSRRFEYDVWYVDHMGFWLDLKIILMTVIKVFKAEGISSSTSATMEKFGGNG